ncbi:MAG: ion transporter [Desulfobacterales bacterium]|nr:ion transporter [Desulfobacterales bacterium]MDD4072515.1 ion transporter [Desulfobacterales bacterium]MDD4393708.1 ion transporter [Desulfobacterales bacterium]
MISDPFDHRPAPRWRSQLHEIIFEADTPAGKAFDVVLIWSIIISVSAVILESMSGFKSKFGSTLFAIEWFFTILFTIEYILRLLSVGRPLRYAKSFFGIVDLLAVIPTYASLFMPGSQYLLTVRILRLLRIFRVFKLTAYLNEAKVLTSALRASRRKISVFLLAVITIVVIIGSLMYVIEGEENGFTDIPASIYWAIVTMTTVGYGDVSPQTPFGKAIASLVMIMGYGIIAVPTGIVTVGIAQAVKKTTSTQACPQCGAEGHDPDAGYCKYCGAHL